MSTGINVISGISGHPEDILKAYLQGTLSYSRFSMPGCRGDGFRRGIKQSTLDGHGNRGRIGIRREGHGRQMKAHGRSFNNSIEEEVK